MEMYILNCEKLYIVIPIHNKVIEPLARRSQISNLELVNDLAEVIALFTI